MDSHRSRTPQGGVLDLHSIAFPTDSITLGQMRRHEPYLLDELSTSGGHLAANDAFATHRYEVMLALKAYATAIGKPDLLPDTSQPEIVAHLSSAYAAFDLGKGELSIRELVKSIETQAIHQAAQAQTR